MKSESRHFLSRFLIVGIMLGFTTVLSRAQVVLVGYNFAGLTGVSSNNGTDTPATVAGAEEFVAPNMNDGSAYNSSLVSATNLVRGAGYTNQVQNNGTNSNFDNNSVGIYSSNNTYPTTVSGSLTGNDYLQFTINGDGSALSLNSISFGAGSQNNSGVEQLGLAYSTDGVNFTAVGSDTGIPNGDYTGGTGAFDSPLLATVSLSGISALQNTTGTVYIDLFIMGADSYNDANFTTDEAGTGTASNLDDVTLTGTVASSVPEPATYAIFLGGIMFLAFMVRRRTQQV